MPLPKAPSKPAALLDPNAFVEAKASRNPPRPRLASGGTNPRGNRGAADAIGAAAAAEDMAPVPHLLESIDGSALLPALRASAPPAAGREPAAIRPAGSAPGGAPSPVSHDASPQPASLAPTGLPQPAPTARAPGQPSAVAKDEAPRRGPQAATRRSVARVAGERPKLFVLDTNVLMHDPTSLFRFAEHDVFLPMITLEELDDHKKGMTEVSRNARQVSRSLDALFGAGDASDLAARGIPLAKLGHDDAKGSLFLQTQELGQAPSGLPPGKADNQILGVVRALAQAQPDRQVVLVSKDINMRVKARALGLAAEDYFNDQVVEDTDLLYSGILALPDNFWDRHGKGMESWLQGGHTFYRVTGPLAPAFHVNQFVYLEGDTPLAARVREINGRTAVLQTLRDFGHHKNAVWGVIARNREQNFALNLLMDPEVDFVTLLGQAGTGKTLLTLAAGLAQTLEHKRYSEIIVTRATVPVGEDIGYLPGTEEEKMQPWMGALEDNLEVLQKGDDAGGEWGRAAAQDLIRSRIRVKALSFMRGRTFINKYLIIDEAQNLTPKQMKTLITRAGPGTKVVCLGNIAQIDTPYLTESSSGLTYAVDRFKGWAHGGHVTLQRGERSRLADFAADAL